MRRFDTRVPNVARMYDYALNGKDNFQADRDAAEEIRNKSPEAFAHAHDNRKFLKRAVQWAATYRANQFIDIGSGLPTRENTHEIAQQANVLSRVVYVDNDPVVLNHATALLADDQSAIAIGGDLRNPEGILSDPALNFFIDLRQSVTVILVAVLHFLDDPQAHTVTETLKQALTPGSCLIISHATADDGDDDQVKTAKNVYDRASAPLTPRTLEEVSRFFDGFEPVGTIGDINAWWNPAQEKRTRTACYGGVAIKPGT